MTNDLWDQSLIVCNTAALPIAPLVNTISPSIAPLTSLFTDKEIFSP